MSKPRLLDLFCGVGGCSMGYHLAGFDVTGIDLRPQPNYPFRFIQGDALLVSLNGYDCYHASPPCQHYSVASKMNKTAHRHPDLIAAVRAGLVATGKFYVMENVPSAPLLVPRILCGTSFKGLRVIRHRLFETNFWFRNLRCGPHPPAYVSKVVTPTLSMAKSTVTVAGHMCGNLEHAQTAMGIPWARTMKEVVEAIPPPYTRYIGKYLMDALGNNVRYSEWWQPDFLA